jgi:hypothetical protein
VQSSAGSVGLSLAEAKRDESHSYTSHSSNSTPEAAFFDFKFSIAELSTII